MARRYLFLQACTSSPFFHLLGKTLRERGHVTGRVHFNVGDALFWYGGRQWHYRGQGEAFGDLARALILEHGFTDLVMFGDTRSFHRAALNVADELGVTCHVFEEGYFRPHWITLERGGVNGYSRLPRDPEWYLEVAPRVAEQHSIAPLSTPVYVLGAWEVLYHLPNLLNPLLYPKYRTHRAVISGVEFAGWAKRYARLPFSAQGDAAAISRLLSTEQSYYFFPLQLDGDSQITYHAPFASITEAIRTVIVSFARYAPAHTSLVIKNHPLDTGLTDYGAAVRSLSKALDIETRVLYLETGNLNNLLPAALGVVTINSTVGTAALAAGRPLIALGKAVYDIPGLGFQAGLDDFWQAPIPPDAQLFEAFRRVVMHTTQVNGAYYSRAGCKAGVENAMRFLEPQRSPLEALLT